MSSVPALTTPETTATLRDAAAGRGLELRVASGSMRPWLTPGDTVTILPAEVGDLRLGDIVAVAAPGGIVVHRYLGVCARGRALLMRGDALAAPDEPQPIDRLIGRVTCVTSSQSRGRRSVRVRRPIGPRASACLGALSQALTLSGWFARSMLAAARGRQSPARPGLSSHAPRRR